MRVQQPLCHGMLRDGEGRYAAHPKGRGMACAEGRQGVVGEGLDSPGAGRGVRGGGVFMHRRYSGGGAV